MKRILFGLLLVVTAFAQTQTYMKVNVDRKLFNALASLFDEKPRELALFLSPDSTYVVEAMYGEKKLVRTLTPEELLGVTGQPDQKFETLKKNYRTKYLIDQTILGLGVYSWGLANTLFGTEPWESGNSKGYYAVTLFTPFVYSGALFLATRNRQINEGAEYGSIQGGIEGAAHGGLLLNSRFVLPVSLTENLFDFYLGQRSGIMPGAFQRKFNHCLYGYYHTLAGAVLANPDDVSDSTFRMIGSIASLVEGYTALYFSRHSENLTSGDAIFELRSCMIGAQTIPMILLSTDLHSDDDIDLRIYAVTSLAGYAAGYYIGMKLSERYDLTEDAGGFTFLLPYLVHGVTAGIGVLVADDAYWETYPIIYSVLDIGATYIVYKNMAKKATVNPDHEGSGFNFMFNPVPLVAKNTILRTAPIAGISYRF